MSDRTHNGIPEGKPGGPWSACEIAFLHENYSTMKVRGISATLGRSETAIHVRANLEGLKSLHHAGANSLVPGYFRLIDTPMKAYLLGLLLTDGSRHGVVHRKTLITTWPTDLPECLENSFICGCYDGDGSLDPRWIYRWSLVSGVPEFLVGVQEHIKSRTGIKVGGPYEDKRHEHAWSIVVTGRPVRELDAWIHREVPGLTRKRLSSFS